MSKRSARRRRPPLRGAVAGLPPASFFRALADPGRLALLARLAACGRPCTVSEIARCCPVNLSVVSRHLALLREAGVLDARRSGRQVHYTVRLEALARTLRTLADGLEACCPARRRPTPTPRRGNASPARSKRHE